MKIESGEGATKLYGVRSEGGCGCYSCRNPNDFAPGERRNESVLLTQNRRHSVGDTGTKCCTKIDLLII